MHLTRCDLSLAVAPFRRRWGTTSLLVLLLAMGIALATVSVSIGRFMHATPLPWGHAEKLVLIGQKEESRPDHVSNLTLENYLAIRDAMQSIESVVGLRRWGSATWKDARGTEVVTGALASPGYFDALGVPISLGRAPALRQESRRPLGLVLTHELWARRFGADSAAIGQFVSLNDEPREIVAVLPAGQELPNYERGDMPEYFDVLDPDSIPRPEWESRWYQAVAWRKEGVTLKQIQAELDVQTERLRELYPRLNAGRYLVVQDFRAWVFGAYGRYFNLLMAMAALLTLAVGVNAANLVLSRLRGAGAFARTATALGARPRQVRAPLYLEHVLLAFAGTVGAVPLTISFAVLVRWWLGPARLDLPAFEAGTFFAIVLCALGALLALVRWSTRGWFGNRTKAELANAVRRSVVSSRRAHPVDQAAVALQATMAVTLVTLAVVIASSLFKRDRANDNLRLPDLHELYVTLRADKYPTPEALFAGWQAIKTALRELPGVRGVTLTRTTYPTEEIWPYGFIDDQDTVPPHESSKRAIRTTGDENYFALTGVRILAGRGFEAVDIQPGRRTIVLSEELAKSYWPNSDPIGRRVLVGHRTEDWSEVIGVAGNFIGANTSGPLPLLWRSWAGTVENHSGILIDFERGAAADEETLRRMIWSVDRDASYYGYGVVRENMAFWNWLPRTVARLAGVLATVAAVVGGLGLFSVLGRRVADSQREIAVRKALGASMQRLLVGFAWRDALAVTVGALLGIVAGLAGVEALFPADNLNAGEKAIAPSLALLVVVLGASLGASVPLARAMALDPVPLLRAET